MAPAVYAALCGSCAACGLAVWETEILPYRALLLKCYLRWFGSFCITIELVRCLSSTPVRLDLEL